MKKLTVKRALSLLMAGTFVLAGTTACNKTPSGDGSQGGSGGETLNVGALVSTVGIPAIYAEEKGYFDEAGLDVNIIIFPTGAPVNEAIAAKQIDVACSGFASVYSIANADCSWIADINSTGGIGLYARPDSDIAKATTEVDGLTFHGSAETVKGAQVLEPLGTSAQFITECYVEKLGLTGTDVNQVHMEYGPGFQAFVAGEGDILSVSPPYSYDCLDKGYVAIASFEDATGVEMMDGCFARNDILESRSEDVKTFLKVLVKAMDELQDEDVRFEYTINKYHENAQEFTDENMRKEIADRKYMGTEFISQSDYVMGEAWLPISEFLVDVGKITEDAQPNVVKNINPSILSEVTGLDIKGVS